MRLALLVLIVCGVAGASEIESVDTAEDTERVPTATPHITITTSESGTPAITFGPTAMQFMYPADGGRRELTITNGTTTKFSVLVTADGNSFGIVGQEIDHFAFGSSASPEMAMVAFSVAPGESVLRTIVFDPSYAIEEVTSGSISFDFTFDIPEIDNPSNDSLRVHHPEISIELAGFGMM